MKKRILSFILALTMIVGMIPAGTMTVSAQSGSWNGYTWTARSSFPSSSGRYYLTSDLNGCYKAPSGTTYLDLNGHTITGGSSEYGAITVNSGSTLYIYNSTGTGKIQKGTNRRRGIRVLGGTVYLCSGTITGFNYDRGAGVEVSSGTFYMQGGTIQNCSVNDSEYNYGGAVWVHDSGKFVMSGGTITGCSATDGGGVYVDGSNAKFEMTGGEIKSCSASKNGGGVAVCSSGNFTFSGGKIDNNKQTSTSDSYSGGGGVALWGGCKFTLSGGEIYSNTAAGKRGGGGLYVADSKTTATMSSGKIYSNTTTYSSSSGGGVYIRNSCSFSMSGGQIYSNTTMSSGGGIYTDSSTLSLTGGSITSNSCSTSGHGGGVEYISGSLTLGGSIKITDNTSNGATSNLHFNVSSTSTPTISSPSSTMKVGVSIGSDKLTGAGRFTKTSTSYSGYSVKVLLMQAMF